LARIKSIYKHTLHIHLIYSILEGLIKGAFLLNEFVFIKSMNGSNYHLSFLFQFSMLVMLGSVAFNELLRRISRKRKFIFYVGLITRLPLLTLLFFPKDPALYTFNSIYHLWFLGLFFIFYLSNPVILPTINLLLKNAYGKEYFGKYYSYGQQAEKITILVVMFLFGLLQDNDHYAFTYIYPLMAIIGIASVFLLTKIKYTPQPVDIKIRFWESVKASVLKMFGTLKGNRAFLHYQISFMLYGFAFMSTASVITIFFKDELLLNYSSVAFYKNAFNIIAIFMFPLFGRLIDRIDPRKFLILTFLSLGGYILFVMFSQWFTWSFDLWEFKIYPSLIIAIIFMGIFTATMSLSWNIGSSYFGKAEEAADYQSIHLTLTGFRAMFAPILGVFFLEKLGYTFTFSLAILVLISGIFVILFSLRENRF